MDKKNQEIKNEEPSFEFTKEHLDKLRKEQSQRNRAQANLVTGDIVSDEQNFGVIRRKPG